MLKASRGGDASGCPLHPQFGDMQGKSTGPSPRGFWVALHGWHMQAPTQKGWILCVGGGIFQELLFRPVFIQFLNNLGASQIICSIVHLAIRAVVTRWGDNSLA